MTHTYNITGMTCGKCVAKVKSELLKLGDIISAEVQLKGPQAEITMSKHIAVPVLQQAINKAGPYTISEGDHVEYAPGPDANSSKGEGDSYFPIVLIFGFIAGVAFFGSNCQEHIQLAGMDESFHGGLLFCFFIFQISRSQRICTGL